MKASISTREQGKAVVIPQEMDWMMGSIWPEWLMVTCVTTVLLSAASPVYGQRQHALLPASQQVNLSLGPAAALVPGLPGHLQFVLEILTSSQTGHG